MPNAPHTKTKKPTSAKAPLPKRATVAKRAPAPRHQAPSPVPAAPEHATTARRSYDFNHAVGRRKAAIARVRLYPKGTGKVTVNEREYASYFPTLEQQLAVMQPLRITGTDKTFDVGVKVSGGGTHGQAEAVRHGIARTLLLVNEEYRRPLRAAGCLTRDSRVKERKKYGLKKARRAPQFSKR